MFDGNCPYCASEELEYEKLDEPFGFQGVNCLSCSKEFSVYTEVVK